MKNRQKRTTKSAADAPAAGRSLAAQLATFQAAGQLPDSELAFKREAAIRARAQAWSQQAHVSMESLPPHPLVDGSEPRSLDELFSLVL